MIIISAKKFLKSLIIPIELTFFNWKNKTKLNSIKASLKAQYGLNVVIGENTYIAANVSIGDFTYINSGSYIENCVIGKFCSISSGVYICPVEHDYNLLTTHPISRKMRESKVVRVGNDVLISLNVVVLQGVYIGDGAVIAAGSIVTKDVKPYEIVGGNPAKHIKYRFEDEKISRILKSEWWNWDIEIIKNELKNNSFDL